jgi:hypothetical protein
MDDIEIKDTLQIVAILAYNNAHQRPTWCIHTPPTSKIGGFSCKLIGPAVPQLTRGTQWEIEHNNGDREIVDMSEVHLSGRI